MGVGENYPVKSSTSDKYHLSHLPPPQKKNNEYDLDESTILTIFSGSMPPPPSNAHG